MVALLCWISSENIKSYQMCSSSEFLELSGSLIRVETLRFRSVYGQFSCLHSVWFSSQSPRDVRCFPTGKVIQ